MNQSIESTPALRVPSGHAPLAVAHKGASGERPENTLAAFERAVELKVDFIELDVHLSSEGVPVVIHDHDLDRTTNGIGPVRAATLADLKKLDAGSWASPPWPDQRVPTLNQVLESIGDKARFLIEIKTGPFDYTGIEDKVAELIRQAGLIDSVVVISFDHWVLHRLRRTNPSLATGAVYGCRPADPVSMARAAGADLLMPHWSFVTREDVGLCHAAGLSVFPWTVDEPELIRNVAQAGVDGIVSNWPDRVMELRESAGWPVAR